MALSFKFWDDCVHPLDIEALWQDPQVRTEWLDAGESKGEKVHLSRDLEGQPFLTQIEMRVVAEIIIRRHFHSQVDVDMICAIAELESDRQLLVSQYIKKTKETTFGLLQISSKIANWLYREHGYRACELEEETSILYRPFVNVYFGVAYLKWLSNFEHRARGEEYVVRAFKGGTKKANHKSTLSYWRRYIAIKESLPTRNIMSKCPSTDQSSDFTTPIVATTDDDQKSWDSRTSPEDMEEMWNNREVHKQWIKFRQTRGKVQFRNDDDKGFYLSRVELKAVAEILLYKHFSSQMIKPLNFFTNLMGITENFQNSWLQAFLCAIVEITSGRFLNGVGSRIGLTGIDYPTAKWLRKELGYKAYKVKSAEDLRRPFESMYFGAAYVTWLSEYEGRERSLQFIVRAYLSGPKNVMPEETTCPAWLKFEEELSYYEGTKRESGSCNIM